MSEAFGLDCALDLEVGRRASRNGRSGDDPGGQVWSSPRACRSPRSAMTDRHLSLSARGQRLHLDLSVGDLEQTDVGEGIESDDLGVKHTSPLENST